MPNVTCNDLVFLKGIISYRTSGLETSHPASGSKRSLELSAPPDSSSIAWRTAVELKDLGAMPGNRLEALKGYRKGQYSIRINDQWRICFEWPTRSPGPAYLEIVDYH